MVNVCFSLTGAVINTSALFTYDSEYLLDTYFYVPRHDQSFVPVFSVPENPDDPLTNQAAEICSGEGSQFCRYVKKSTNSISRKVGRFSKIRQKTV